MTYEVIVEGFVLQVEVTNCENTPPINRVMEVAGKRWALDFVQGLGASIRREPTRTKAIADLTRYAVTQPSSVASGVKIVIDLLKEAS